MKLDQDSHHMKPDYYNTKPAAYYAYIAAVAEHLKSLPTTGSDAFGQSKVHVDNVPIVWDGITMGFLVISEIDGVSWDYCDAIIDKDVHPDEK